MTPDTAAAVDAWNAFLDEMDRDLAAVNEQLTNGGSVVAAAPVVPPGPLPPLPRSLVKRAAFVLERTRQVEERIAERAEETRRRLAAVDQQNSERRPVRPAFFDRAF